MSRIWFWAVFAVGVLLLCGCWDQQLMKNERNVSIGGIDQGSNGMIRATVSIRDISVTESGTKDTSEVHSVLARSTQHAREKIDEEISGSYSAAKLRVLLISEEFVKNQDMMPYLDVYYRDPKSPLSARIAVTKGKAEDMIAHKKIGSKTIGLYIDDLLNSLEKSTTIPRVNIQTLHPLDRGFDFSLPYLIDHNGKPTVSGIALFKGVQMTATLDQDDSKLYLLLSNLQSKKTLLTLRVDNPQKSNGYDYVSIEIKSLKRKLKVTVSDDQQIKVKLQLKLRVSVVEDPSNHLYSMSVLHNLEKILAEELTDDSKEIVQKMQRAGHDGFGIARRLMSFHPKLWKQINWSEEYPKIPFDTSVSLQIVNTGITE
ncbi:Ger(x)C family germination protein [Paenibacillus castaneae]|uniref:Ger(x)C family spore germination protein n=1 Tax=Paenibacillus castaneae TaxID=474957 RepID=UPI000C9A5839|nr:Ger(x)C family spore germination protein [Paenibacillus castaneae]NIK78945.1 Ger(x)C family germination protein [Paenibacillus castaneae]